MLHPLQRQLLDLVRSQDLVFFSLKKIAESLNKKDEHPQKIKHHLLQLEKKGLIAIDRYSNTITAVGSGKDAKSTGMRSIPVCGLVYCSTNLEDTSVCDRFSKFLTISERVLPSTPKKRDQLFALRAVGNSMNRAKIRDKKPIRENDYIIVDPNIKKPKNGQYIVAKINGVFVAKKFFESKGDEKCVLLMSESDQKHPPIVMDSKEFYDHALKGRVIDVIHDPESR